MRRIGMIIIAIALIGIAIGAVFVLANPPTSTHQARARYANDKIRNFITTLLKV